jgi:hypothetical protein
MQHCIFWEPCISASANYGECMSLGIGWMFCKHYSCKTTKRNRGLKNWLHLRKACPTNLNCHVDLHRVAGFQTVYWG